MGMKMILSSNVAVLFSAAVTVAFLPATVDGHAFMTEPPTRNSYAQTRANWDLVAGVPPAETTPQGLNSNTNVCGKEGGNKDYDEWLDSTGAPMSWFSHVSYDRGDEIRVDVKVTAHHYGHFEVKACPNGRASTQECFDQNPLTYVEEIVGGNRLHMPKDEANPHRAMLHGDSKEVSYKMKLPDNIVGDEVLLQWVYWTTNNCNYDGYDDYFERNKNIMPSTKNWNSGLSGCGDQSKIPMIRTGTVIAEIFVNCAEVTVLGDGSPVSPRPPPPVASPIMVPVADPTMKPVAPVADPTMQPVSYNPPPTAKPVSVAPPTGGNGECGEPCCSQNFKTCAGWGGDSQSSCESMGSMKWLECGPIDSECLGKDASCTNNVDSCCSSLTCDGNEWYKQCKFLPNSGRQRDLKQGNVRSF